jgi:hypothetical protein
MRPAKAASFRAGADGCDPGKPVYAFRLPFQYSEFIDDDRSGMGLAPDREFLKLRQYLARAPFLFRHLAQLMGARFIALAR